VGAPKKYQSAAHQNKLVFAFFWAHPRESLQQPWNFIFSSVEKESVNERGQYDYWTLVVRTRLRVEPRNCGPFPDPKETGLPMKKAGQLNQIYE